MFDGLFDEEEPSQTSGDVQGRSKHSSSLPRPLSPRGSTGLCGLSNLGATCYLNSILQTLHYTPEFRESLFDVEEADLGILEAPGNHGKVRVIPIQLQRLFARLLLLNRSSADVTPLTDSFGWTNSEEFQQHDVQELNRILFSAIESSLLGTSGEQLISKLYHGITVQQITCQVCSRVSEREEEFLDIPVALSGQAGLNEALKESFIKLEQLDGSNQYFCGSCKKLVDAKRGCHIRKLPSILTFALLRFLYDFKKGERYKDISKFKFPLVLDMAPFCEAGSVTDITMYELFSVVIHSGSTHSGHYVAYIRDVDDLGKWTYPENAPVKLPADPSAGSTDLIDYENPADLLCALLRQLGGTATISKLCKYLQDQTGVTWNKRFKKQFGPIVKFVKSCAEVFSLSDTNQASLKTFKNISRDAEPSISSPAKLNSEISRAGPKNSPSPMQRMDTCGVGSDEGDSGDVMMKVDMMKICPAREQDMPGDAAEVSEEEFVEVGGMATTAKSRPLPPPGERWFEFNDTHVSPITSPAIEKIFQGKRSAYMLFYRKTSARRPIEARCCSTFRVPQRLLSEVAEENEMIEKERLEYEVAMNSVRLHLHLHSDYHYNNAALYRKTDSDSFSLSIDKRKTVRELKELINQSLHLDESYSVIHTARFLPAGLHLYDVISDKDEASIAALDITNDFHLFLWDGAEVGGEPVLVGDAYEPVQLLVTYPVCAGEGDDDEEEGEVEVALAFTKDSTLWEVRVALSDLLGVHPNQVTISHVKVQERRGHAQSAVVILGSGKDKCSLSQLPLTDGDKLAVEKEVKKGVQTLAHSVADKQNKRLSFIVEDRVHSEQDSHAPYPVFSLEMGKDEQVAALKRKALHSRNIKTEVRFRVLSDMCGLGPPLYESQSLVEAELTQGQKVIMECGIPPLSSQVALQCSPSCLGRSSGMSGRVEEVLVEKSLTVGECCLAMAVTLGLTGDEWHLRKTNWCGEEAGILEDETATLEQEKLKPGELLLVEPGRLPPKGFIKFAVFLFHEDCGPSLPHSVVASEAVPTSSGHAHISESDRPAGMAGCVDSSTKDEELPLHLAKLSKYYPPLPGIMLEVGSVEVNRDCTVDELKTQILTLSSFADAVIPTINFLRLRELVKGRLGRIHKIGTHSLRRLKLTSDTQICCQILNYDEFLQQSALVFHLCMRSPTERRYGPMTEVIYDTEGAVNASSPHALRSFLAEVVQVPLEHLCLAKHKVEAFDWIPIEDFSVQKRGRKKSRGQASSSIKNSPIMLRDGDIIGFKDLRLCDDVDKDFTTPDDDRGKAILLAIQEDKRKRRKAKEDFDIFGPKEKRQRRPERGIKIYVPDYRSN